MINKNIEKFIKELREFYVEMHPMHGHDAHNPPLLYHIKSEGVDELFSSIRQFLHQIRQETLEEIENEIKEQTIPAIARDEEIECCNCGEDLALESYEWVGEGYDLAKDDIINIIQSKKENI